MKLILLSLGVLIVAIQGLPRPILESTDDVEAQIGSEISNYGGAQTGSEDQNPSSDGANSGSEVPQGGSEEAPGSEDQNPSSEGSNSGSEVPQVGSEEPNPSSEGANSVSEEPQVGSEGVQTGLDGDNFGSEGANTGYGSDVSSHDTEPSEGSADH